MSEALARLTAALGLDQTTRLLQLETPLPANTLVVERCRITESVHAERPLWAEIDCLSTDAHLPLKALTGEQLGLRLQRAHGLWRTWHGYAAQCANLGADGSLARYRLVLAAWTHWLSLRRDTRIFQDRHAQDILNEVFQAYPQAHVRFDLSTPGPMRPICTQYRETDWAFAQRLMAQEGWSWRIDHDAPTDDALPGPRAARHCLVVFDAQAALRDVGALRFSRPGLPHVAAHDTITQWSVGQTITPNAVTVGAWDERRVAGIAAQAHSTLPHGVAPPLETYVGHGERRFVDGRVADRQTGRTDLAANEAQNWLAAQALHRRTIEAQGSVRALAPTDTFALTDHSLYGVGSDQRFTVLAVVHEVANNLSAQAARVLAQPDLEHGAYRNRFTAVPAGTRIVPTPQPAPRAEGVQLAQVMGQHGEAVHADRDGRIRIQFPWQRGVRPLPGGAAAPQTVQGQATGHAPGDAGSGTWVRVAQDVAGPNWGALFTPRAGSEVVVDFIDGDIDRPIVIGQLHNAPQPLPWPAGVDSSANHLGSLSGWHHPHLDGSGVNQWVIDDHAGQLRMRLLSQGSMPAGHSELSLGSLVEQTAWGGSAYRGRTLGEGFYGSSDGWSIVRAQQGLLLTTAMRPALGASVHGTQMDADEAVAALRAGQQLGQALSDSARQQGAQPLHSHDEGAAWSAHTEALDVQQAARYAGTVNGQDARQASPGSRALNEPVHRFTGAQVHLDTPASAALVTPEQISLFAGQDTSLSAQGDLHLSSAHTLSAVSGQTTSFYTHAGGIKAITANAALSLRAHTDAQQIWSEQDLTVQSVADEIRIQAHNSITLTAGQSRIVLQGGDITFTCPGTWTVKGATHGWGGGARHAAQQSCLPDSRVKLFDRRVRLLNELTGEPMCGAPYQMLLAEGDVLYGTTDDAGFTALISTPAPQEVQIIWGATRDQFKA